jgi:hypothetical protein
MSVAMPIGRGLVTIVDEADYEKVKGHGWYAFAPKASIQTYARTCIRRRNILLHRLILQAERGVIVDHINGNGLDNRRCNLRATCNGSLSQLNRPCPKNNKSGFKGVHIARGRYVARLQWNRRCIHLGSFDSPVDAALAYNAKALELGGEFAWLNPIPTETRA